LAGVLAQWPFYVWLLALYPIGLIAVLNRSQIGGASVVLALAAAAAVVTVCLAGYRALLGSWQKAAALAAVTILLFYAFGPISMAIEWVQQPDAGDPSNAPAAASRPALLLSVLWILLLAAVFSVLRRTKEQRIVRICAPLNLISGILVATVVLQSLASSQRGDDGQYFDATATSAATRTTETPDIYYIILDGYARADVLSKHYGYDNSPFLDALREHGFTINEKSHANYYWTFLSLASSLNMNYLPAVLGEGIDPASQDRSTAYERIRNNVVAQTLRRYGYRFVHLQSTWGATLANPYADTLISCGATLFTDEFYRTLAEASWLRVLMPHASGQLAECHKKNFASLAAIAAEDGPKFVFAHFILPHHPYLFDRHGNVLRDATIANQFDFQAFLWEKRAGYLEQLLYVNDSVLDTVSQIVSSSEQPPVIVLQSDHGPQLSTGLDEEEQQRARLANLAAFHLPGATPNLIPQGDSPVNFFRRILGFYLGTELPPLANRYYYSWYNRPYGFKDVTALIEHEPQVASAAPQ
jgi:hypothetical protein